MLKYSYKKIVKTLPQFELVVDKKNTVLMVSSMAQSFKLKAQVSILIEQCNATDYKLLIHKNETIYFRGFYTSESMLLNELHKNVLEAIDLVEVDNIFS